MLANLHCWWSEWKILVKTNVAGGQYCPKPKEDIDIVKIWPIFSESQQQNQAGTRGDFLLLSHNNELHDGTADLQDDNKNSNKMDYNADTNMIVDEDNIYEEGNGE